MKPITYLFFLPERQGFSISSPASFATPPGLNLAELGFPVKTPPFMNKGGVLFS
jgi:hypothetical protein